MDRASIKKNIAYNMIKTFSSIVFPMITFPYVSRVLQPENIGKINFSSTFVNYFLLIASLGVATYAIRECSRRKEKESLERTASEIFSINICSMAVSYLLLAVTLTAVPRLMEYRALICIQSAAILFAIIGTEWLNTAMEDFRYITLRSVSVQLLSLCLMFIFVRGKEDYMRYVWISLLASGGAQIMNIAYRRRYCRVRFIWKMNWKEHLPPILLLFAMLVSQTILHSIDTTMLGFMKGDYEVGLYTTAVKMVNIVSQVIMSITWVLMPRLTQAFAERSYDRISSLLKKAAGFSALLLFPCLAGIFVLSKEIILIIGGEEYRDAALALGILAGGMAFNVISNIFGNMVLLPDKREKQFTWACIAGMLCNVVANAVLIPKYGIYGASAATVLSAAVIAAGTMLKKDTNIRFVGLGKCIKAPAVGALGIIFLGIAAGQLKLGLWMKTAVTIMASVLWYAGAQIIMKNEIVMEPLKGFFHREER